MLVVVMNVENQRRVLSWWAVSRRGNMNVVSLAPIRRGDERWR